MMSSMQTRTPNPTVQVLTQEVADIFKTHSIKYTAEIWEENFQPEGKRIMPETRLTSFPALYVDPRVGIS